MKKMAVWLTLLVLTMALPVTAFAQTDESVDVYVTIADKDGRLALAQDPVTVTDVDEDDALTIHDALYAAHEVHYEGGAAAGYATLVTEFGMSMDKLWGTANGGSYGYYVNHQSAWSLVDPVKEGDYINAYVFTDLTAWSDTYSYFDVNTVTADTGEAITLTLSAAGYDSAYNPITIPVENAVITLNGEATDFTTDNNGKVTITIDHAGNYMISALSDTMTLVPPVCKATIVGDVPSATTTTSATTSTTMTTKTETTTVTTTDVPKTGESVDLLAVATLWTVSVGVALLSCKSKLYEK